jgi:hypothetical protein
MIETLPTPTARLDAHSDDLTRSFVRLCNLPTYPLTRPSGQPEDIRTRVLLSSARHGIQRSLLGIPVSGENNRMRDSSTIVDGLVR